ncbi:MAG: hypothetical protein ACRDP6_13165 [Actinoallomurus sp.]
MGSPRGPLGCGPLAQRIFGPDRRRHLRAELQRSAKDQRNDSSADQRKQLSRELAGLQHRQDNLIDQLENFEATGDTDADREYRQTIQRRFAELTITRRTKQSELDQIKIDAPPAGDDADLLDQIPQAQADMTELPESLERELYDAFHLKVRYNRPRHEATIQVTIREDTISTFTKAAQDDPGEDGRTSSELDPAFPSSGCPRQVTQKMGTPSERAGSRQLVVESVVSLPPAPRGVHAIQAAQERRATASSTDHLAEAGEQ